MFKAGSIFLSNAIIFNKEINSSVLKLNGKLHTNEVFKGFKLKIFEQSRGS